MKKNIIVGISGASGVVYGIRLIQTLLRQPLTIYAIVSPSAWLVIEHEMGFNGPLDALLSEPADFSPHPGSQLHDCDPGDLFSAPASGSFRHHGMVVCPCSMKTLGAISSGQADNLLLRSADVTLKEKRPLLLVLRETPFNKIHLRNMLAVADAGATIMPASPGFYQQPHTIDDLVDFMVARICDHMEVAHQLIPPWGAPAVTV